MNKRFYFFPAVPASVQLVLAPATWQPAAQTHEAPVPMLWSVKMKTDGMNPVPSAIVYRIFLSVFVFCGINGNGTENGTD
jgi:hypothetical protein